MQNLIPQLVVLSKEEIHQCQITFLYTTNYYYSRLIYIYTKVQKRVCSSFVLDYIYMRQCTMDNSLPYNVQKHFQKPEWQSYTHPVERLYVPRSTHCPDFDCLQCVKIEGKASQDLCVTSIWIDTAGKSLNAHLAIVRNPVKNQMVGRTGNEANKPTNHSTWAGQTVDVLVQNLGILLVRECGSLIVCARINITQLLNTPSNPRGGLTQSHTHFTHVGPPLLLPS